MESSESPPSLTGVFEGVKRRAQYDFPQDLTTTHASKPRQKQSRTTLHMCADAYDLLEVRPAATNGEKRTTALTVHA